MKLKRTIAGPILIALVAFVSGGWLLQRGVAGEAGAFQQARIFDEVLNRISRSYVNQHASDELYRMAVDGLLRELGDPHTTFMSAEEYAELRRTTTGEYGGLGIQISEKDGWVTVIAPLPGTPAERAGILAGDRIVEVEGQSTEGWSDQDAVNVLRGPKGTAVNIRVARIGVDEPIAFSIVRDEIHVQSVRSAYMVEPGVGYANLTLFSETSTEELREAIETLRGEGMRGMILDLRMNPGGLLDQGVSISDLFLDRGQAIVETRSRDPKENMTFRASLPEVTQGLTVLVLVNEFSASAAEIVAGALQDHDRALVLGTPTFGKGSVQTLFPLSGGNFLKMTTGRWYTPVGRSIQKEGGSDDGALALLEEEAIGPDGAPHPSLESDDTVPREAFRTDGGRTVYGGGGIVPDLIVRPDTLTTGEKEFFQAASKAGSAFNDVVFAYAIEFVNRNQDLSADFEVTPQMHAEFYQKLTAAGIEVTPDQFEGARRLLDQRLAYEITLSKWGQGLASQRANSEDNIVRRAAEMLRDAPSQAALFQRAQAEKRAAR